MAGHWSLPATKPAALAYVGQMKEFGRRCAALSGALLAHFPL
jgi:hypothetical protein